MRLCCQSAFVQGCLHLGRTPKQCRKKNGKCKSEKGTHDNCRKDVTWKKCKLKRKSNCKWRKSRKSTCNLERGTLNKWWTHGRNQRKLEGGGMIRRIKTDEMQPGKKEIAKCSKHGNKNINLDKLKPTQKTRDTLNLKKDVRGEPVKPKKNAQCWGSRMPSVQVASRKIRIGYPQYFLKEIGKDVKRKIKIKLNK